MTNLGNVQPLHPIWPPLAATFSRFQQMIYYSVYFIHGKCTLITEISVNL